MTIAGAGIYDTALSEEEVVQALGPPATFFTRIDTNADSTANIADAIFVLGYLFGGGSSPPCLDAADANDDGKIDIADAIAVLGYLFGGLPTLPEPFETCGEDPTPDDLGCEAFLPCE